MATLAPVPGDETGLVYRSTEDGPGLHVMLAGISAYRYLGEGTVQEQPETYGLGQLDSAAHTAAALAEWLVAPDVDLAWPVRTIRLVASPNAVEAEDSALLAAATPATLAAFKRALRGWRRDANAHPDGATLFYYCGHGIQRTRGGSTLLLDDFLDPEEATLAHSIDFDIVYNGMAETQFDRMAHTQLYFVDACRSDMDGLEALANATPAQVWDVTAKGVDERIAPIFYGASIGRPAFGAALPGGVSAFGRDVMTCLTGSAADLIRGPSGARWTVTIGSLFGAISQLVAEANRAPGRSLRSVTVDRWTRIDTPIATLRAAPDVACRFTVLPSEVLPHASFTLDAVPGPAPVVFGPPWDAAATTRARAGGYIISAAVAPGCSPSHDAAGRQVVMLKPPFFDYGVTFTAGPGA